MKRISYNQLISRFINEDTCLLDEGNTINTVCGTRGHAVSYLFLELRDTGTYTIMHACISHGYIKRVKRLVNTHISYIRRCVLIPCVNVCILCTQYGEIFSCIDV